MIIEPILEVLYFLLPAALANMMPVFVRKLPILSPPLDGGLCFRGRRLLGKNKTLRGLIFAILGAIFVAYLQKEGQSLFVLNALSIVDYSSFSIPLFGFLIGLGVILGDALGSVLKRQLDIAPGESLLIVDQIDSAVIFPLVLTPLVWIGWTYYFFSILIWGSFHLILKYAGYLLHLEEKKI